MGAARRRGPVLDTAAVTSTAWVLLALAAVAAAVNWWSRGVDSRPVEYVSKPLTLLLLIGVALALDPRHADQRAWFVAALVLSLAGDVFLMLPADRFVAGLASFLLAHVAYVVGINLHPGSAGALLVAAAVVAVVAGAVGVRIVRGLAASGAGRMVGPVIAYMAVISVMVVSALAAGPWAAGAGAVLFFASDGLIAWNRFVVPLGWAPVAIMVTYHLGQAGLVLSLVR